MKRHRVIEWKDWIELADRYNFDPYEEIEFGIDTGGGNSEDWYYAGDIPEREE